MILRLCRCLCCLILVAFFSACRAPEEGTSGQGNDEIMADVNTLSGGGASAFGAGDVEFDMRLVTSIAKQSQVNNLRIEQSESINDRITRIVANWFPPHPDEAWITVLVYSRRNYPAHAVLLKTTIFVNGEVVESFDFVGGPSLKEPKEHLFDVMKYVEGTPETILVHAETRLTLYLETDVNTITPETAPDAPPGAKATVLSNSLRINFR